MGDIKYHANILADTFKKLNSSTGEYEEVGSDLTAGDGITITDKTVAVDAATTTQVDNNISF